MKLTGGCYCKALRYEAEGEPLFRVQCFCRECQYMTGGSPNLVMGMPESGFRYITGEPARFARPDLPAPVSREFCPHCGTHILTRSPRLQGTVLLKVGALDNPSVYRKPDVGIFTCDAQPFHHIPDDIPVHERRPTSFK